MTRAVLPSKLIPAHIITLPPLLVGQLVLSVSPHCDPILGCAHPPFADKTWIHQRRGLVTTAVDSICHVWHKTGALEPYDVGKAEAFSRFSGTEPRGSNSISHSLHRDATCTWSALLSQHSLQTGAIHKALPCYSDCNVSVFMLGCNFWLFRSGLVRNSPLCSMIITKSNNGAMMNVKLVSNILWVNARLYTTQSPGSFFIRTFSQSSIRPCICHNNIDNSNGILLN